MFRLRERSFLGEPTIAPEDMSELPSGITYLASISTSAIPGTRLARPTRAPAEILCNRS